MSQKVYDKEKVRQRKKKHIRKKVLGTIAKPRLTVFRSLKHIYAQLIDDTTCHTILTVSSLTKDLQPEIAKAKSKTEVAKIVGISAAKKAKELKYETIIFDRAGYLYHGRVKALAEGAREGGLIF